MLMRKAGKESLKGPVISLLKVVLGYMYLEKMGVTHNRKVENWFFASMCARV